MVVGLKSTIASSNFGFQVCQGRRLQTRSWSWRSRNVHDCKFGRPVPWQGGGVSRMPRGRVVLWSWRSRNVHDCSLGALYPGRQGGGVSRMPGGRGTPATDSSSTTESHYWGLTSQLSKQSTKQTANYPTGRQTQNARFWDLTSALVQWQVHFWHSLSHSLIYNNLLCLKDKQAHPYQLYYFFSCLTTFVNTINHSYIVKWKFFVLRITFYFQIFSWLVSLNLKK